MTHLLISLLLSISTAGAADAPCPGVDWAKIQKTWAQYDKNPNEKLEKSLLTLLPVDVQETEGCPSYQEAYTAISTHLTGLQKRIAKGSKSPLCVAFRLQAFSSGGFSLELEKLSNEGVKLQKGLDDLAFKNACMTQRKSPNLANFEEKLVAGKMAPSAKSCEKELERFVEAKKEWLKETAAAKTKKKCLAVLKKVAATTPKNNLCTGISELVTSERAAIEEKCSKIEE